MGAPPNRRQEHMCRGARQALATRAGESRWEWRTYTTIHGGLVSRAEPCGRNVEWAVRVDARDLKEAAIGRGM